MPKRRRTRREQDTALYVAFSHSAIEILRLVYQDIGEIEPLDEQKVNTTLKKTLRRSVDFVLLFTIKGQKKLIHIEFQLTDQSEFYYRNFLYLGLLQWEYKEHEIVQIVIYTGKEAPRFIRPPFRLSKVVYEYDLIHLPNFSLDRFSQTKDLVAYSLAASTIKNREELDEFVRKFVNLTEVADVESARVAFAAAESLLSDEWIEMFVDMIRKSELPKSSVLASIENEFFQKGIKEGMDKGIKEGIEKGIREGIREGIEKGKRETAEKALKKGLDVQLVSEMTDLPLKEVEEIARKLGIE
ncbi:MAG: hypothetical protein NZ521_02070 [Flammeovirgaceae bacterium]|nr:hypothetical protein [Flammeovirgaceae bacterium]